MEETQGNQNQDLRSCTKEICQTILEGAARIGSKSPSSFPTIHKVPEDLRKLKESAYTPRLVSIGPLHHKDQHLNHALWKDIKAYFVNFLLCQVEETREGRFRLLEKCLAKMKSSVDEAKKFYANQAEELDAKMLLIDGCFILGLLYVSYCNYNSKAATTTTSKPNDLQNNSKSSNHNDPVFDSPRTIVYVQQDLLLLENQLPFSVLNELFKLTLDRVSDSHPSFTLANYVLLFFHSIMSFGVSSDSTEKIEDIHHILHLIHSHYCPQSPSAGHCALSIENPKKSYSEILSALKEEDDHFEDRPCASDLDFAGVKFVPFPKPRLEVKFSEAEGALKWFRRDRFQIPKLRIDDSTEPLLRNLIALEQCCPGIPQHFTSYAHLMDRLINTDKDVQVLEKAKLIDNYLGADECAADLFNKLSKEVVLGRFHFKTEYKRAAEYSERCWPTSMAYLRRTYFARPWTFIAFCIAFIAFGMSVAQFILSFF